MDCVTVSVPARLHLGFLDLNGGLSRKFGSIGLALDRPVTRLVLRPARRLSASGPDAERALRYLARLSEALHLPGGFTLEIEEAIPAHSGLGSGTQLALAVAAGLRRLSRLPLDVRGDAALLDRGARSGIGIGLFTTGGVVVDGGRTADGPPPPVIAQLAFPEDWRILLLFDEEAKGVHGRQEIDAFNLLPPFPAETSAELCRLVLMQALPALAERDIVNFGAAIATIQERLGDHFAPAQGGRYTSGRVAEAAVMLKRLGAHGSGQSSWGPTGFAFAASAAEARRLGDGLMRETGFNAMIARGRNTGATIEVRVEPAMARG
jgi:beta-ribofuranosylaminobenzene 5'-phosphate synthase